MISDLTYKKNERFLKRLSLLKNEALVDPVSEWDNLKSRVAVERKEKPACAHKSVFLPPMRSDYRAQHQSASNGVVIRTELLPS
jgi:hypothetical protein